MMDKIGFGKGMDMSIFHPHSTTAASTGKAVKKVPLQTVLRRAGWRGASTFTTFYHQSVSSGRKFEEAVLLLLSRSFRVEVANAAVFKV